MHTHAPEQDHTTVSRRRRRLAMATVGACLPYLLLKTCWVAGLSIGSNDATFADRTRGANLLTAGLEVVAILLALAFVHPVARRIPAFLLAFPMWVATGLLTPVVVGFALGTPVQLLSGGANPFEDDVLQPWVFALVYGGFVLEAVLLTAGFVLYARDRWPGASGVAVEARPGTTPGKGLPGSLTSLLGTVFTITAAAFAVQQATWSFAGGGSFADPTTVQRVALLGGAGVAAAAAFAAPHLLRGARPTTARSGLVWTASGVIFTSALVDTLKKVAIAPGEWGATSSGAADATLTLFILLGALAGAIGGAMRLAEAHEASAPPGPMKKERAHTVSAALR